jgi:coniferyl-alcohol glucosyltransferase
MQPEHLTHKSSTLFLDFLNSHRFIDSMMGSKQHAVLFSSPGLGHLILVFELGKHLVTHYNFQATILVIASHTSPAESQVIQSAMSLNLYDIVQLPPPDISNLIDAETIVVSPTCTNDV